MYQFTEPLGVGGLTRMFRPPGLFFCWEEDWAKCRQPLRELEVDVGLGSNYLRKYSFSKRDQLLA